MTGSENTAMPRWWTTAGKSRPLDRFPKNWSLATLLGLFGATAVLAAMLRGETERVLWLVLASVVVSIVLAPLLVWLLGTLLHDLIEHRTTLSFRRFAQWFHWQRGLAMLGTSFLAILWAAIENELVDQASWQASLAPPSILILFLVMATIIRTRARATPSPH